MNNCDECEADLNLYALSIHFDGGARPNPGTGGCGGVVRRRIVGTFENHVRVDEGRCLTKHVNDSNESSWSDDEEVERLEYDVTLGDSDCTNNEAEYMSLILAIFLTLESFQKRCSKCHFYQLRYESIDIYGDSNLVIQQMSGNWQVRGDSLQKLHHFATQLMKQLSGSWTECEGCTGTVRYHHVPRDSNVEADTLASQAIIKPNELFPILPWNEWLYHIHRDTCTSCIKRAVEEAEAASAASLVSKSRKKHNRGHRGH